MQTLDFVAEKGYNMKKGCLAQPVEHSLDVRRVSGSSPLASTKKTAASEEAAAFL